MSLLTLRYIGMDITLSKMVSGAGVQKFVKSAPTTMAVVMTGGAARFLLLIQSGERPDR
jgi:hypothetical protein